jgi:hypothetical protein
VRSGQAIGTVVGCIARAVVECNVIDVESCTVADTEAVNGVVLNVDVVDCARSENRFEFDEMVGPGKSSV